MPLPLIHSLLPSLSPYFSPSLIISCLLIYTVHIYFNGRRTTSERDLHDRTFIVTGVLDVSLALPLIVELARRGATVIGTVDRGEGEMKLVEELVESIRAETGNREVYVERVDLNSPAAIRTFVSGVLKTAKRLDGVVCMHEYPTNQKLERENVSLSLSTFYILTLLLPSLLVAPHERDIRLINVVNPFYAAALSSPSFPSFPPRQRNRKWTLMEEGTRSLRSVMFHKHLQSVLDALPQKPVVDPDPPAPTTNGNGNSNGVVESNINTITVNPGLTPSDTVYPFIHNRFLYTLLYPLIYILTKPTSSALQTVLHALFVPTRSKRPKPKKGTGESEVLVPGALYAECRVVHLPEPKSKGGGMGTEKEEVGRTVWEMMEKGVKEWNEAERKEVADLAARS